jgi:glycosyltransferase involved in cell wall biosynthesis
MPHSSYQVEKKSRPISVLYLDASRGLYGASRAMLTLLENLDRDQVCPFVVLANDIDDGDLRMCEELARLNIDYLEYPLAVLRRSKYLNLRGGIFMARSLLGSISILRRIIRERKIDVIQSNTSTIISGGVVSLLTGVPHVWHVHEIFRKREGKIFTRMLNTLSSRVVAISQAAEHNLVSLLPALAPKIALIRNGIDPERFRTVTPETVCGVRRELGIEPADHVVGMIGRLGLGKGEEQFIEMALLVKAARNDVKFVIVGGTFENKSAPFARLQSIIDANGLGSEVIVTGQREDIPELINCMDVLVHLPLRPESFGLIVVEAMAAGKPVVVADMGALAEVVRDGETGFVVAPGDVQSAARKVLGLLDDEELRGRIGRAGSRRVDSEFLCSGYADRFEVLYREMIGQSQLHPSARKRVSIWLHGLRNPA